MTRGSARVGFGLVALEQALAAKAGRWTERGTVELLTAALRDHAADAAVTGAALAYADAVRARPQAAGAALHDWLLDWSSAFALEAAPDQARSADRHL